MLKNGLFFLTIVLFISQNIYSEEGKNGIINENNKKSSSFVVDPDPLDPLPVKKENIKDGDEIILDDIRQIIDQPAKKLTSSQVTPATKSKKNKAKNESKNKNSKTKNKSKTKTKKAKSVLQEDADQKKTVETLEADNNFSIAPTSPDIWENASAKQNQNIYIVQKNDTLFTISQTLFGDSKFWPKVWALNKSMILNPHYIYPGMKIYFYSGNQNTSPSMGSGPTLPNAANIKNDDKYFTQDTEFEKNILIQKGPYFTEPTGIPDSLPLTKNAKYENQKIEAKTEIDLQTFEYNENVNYVNPYILTSTDLKSDFSVPQNQISNLVCVDNQFIPIVTKQNIDVAAGDFLIIKKIRKTESRLKYTNKYKQVGTVKINEKNQMRVNHCIEMMDSESLIVSSDKLQALNEPTEEFKFSARIVDGLDYYEQDMYAEHQLMIINLEGLTVDQGTQLNIFSDELGKRVGQLKIIRKSGTMAIAAVTQVYDIIRRGDKITE